MLIQIILLVVGFTILIKGADLFINGASCIATHFNISKIVIGLTIVSLGTSLPEFAISCKSIIQNRGDIVLGNVIGSNIINILLILGICSIIKPLQVKSNTVKKEIPILVLLTNMFVILLNDNIFNNNMKNKLSRFDGLIIIIFLFIFVYYLFSISKNDKTKENPKFSLKKAILYTIIGIIGILIGSNLAVDNATLVAKRFNINDKIISLTIIALGTSLPELVSSITATIKGEQDILLGNIIGSNIFNIGLVLGFPIFLFGSITPTYFNNFDIVITLLSTLLLFLLAINNKITKKEGLCMVIIFITYYIFTILKGVII